MRPTPETNNALLQSLGAQLEALRLAVFALSAQAEQARLLMHFDAGRTVLQANQQGKPLPDDYLDQLAHHLDRLRSGLVAASTPGPQRPAR